MYWADARSNHQRVVEPELKVLGMILSIYFSSLNASFFLSRSCSFLSVSTVSSFSESDMIWWSCTYQNWKKFKQFAHCSCLPSSVERVSDLAWAAASAVTQNGFLSCRSWGRRAPNHLVFCASARSPLRGVPHLLIVLLPQNKIRDDCVASSPSCIPETTRTCHARNHWTHSADSITIMKCW